MSDFGRPLNGDECDICGHTTQPDCSCCEMTHRDAFDPEAAQEQIRQANAEIAALGELDRLMGQIRQLVSRIPDADSIAEEFANLSREIADAKAIKRGKRQEPVIWSANEQLNAVKWAREQGFVTAAEAQKIARKLLRLSGKRGIADGAQARRQARKGR